MIMATTQKALNLGLKEGSWDGVPGGVSRDYVRVWEGEDREIRNFCPGLLVRLRRG